MKRFIYFDLRAHLLILLVFLTPPFSLILYITKPKSLCG